MCNIPPPISQVWFLSIKACIFDFNTLVLLSCTCETPLCTDAPSDDEVQLRGYICGLYYTCIIVDVFAHALS